MKINQHLKARHLIRMKKNKKNKKCLGRCEGTIKKVVDCCTFYIKWSYTVHKMIDVSNFLMEITILIRKMIAKLDKYKRIIVRKRIKRREGKLTEDHVEVSERNLSRRKMKHWKVI